MKNLLNKIYCQITQKEEFGSKTNSLVLRLLIKLIKKMCFVLIAVQVYVEFYLFKRKITSDDDSGLVVSLTSFPARISVVWLTIVSLGNQTVLPSKIILYLSADEFPQGLNSIPKKLKKLLNRGLEIQFVAENLRSHKKYFYAFQQYPNNSIVTVDDDLYYPPETLERLLLISKKFPKAVVANVVSEIVLKHQKVDTYLNWKKTRKENCIHNRFVAIGHGGVLYPPFQKSLDFFDIPNIKKLAFHADDLWLKAVEMHCNIDVAVGAYFPHPMVIPSSQKVSLKNINTQGEILNDIQWEKLTNHFKLNVI